MQRDKKTEDLEKILQSVHRENMTDFFTENKDEIITSDRPFADYMRDVISKKGIKRQDIFLNADIPERYGYKLLNEEKHTKQRDVILRICYGAHFTLEETQQALQLYGMPKLYVRVPRDVVLMVAFNTRPGSVIDVCTILRKENMEPLRTSGSQE